MKKLLFAFMLFAVTATVFTACKKDDDDNGTSIIGTWHMKKVVEYNLVDGELHGDKITENVGDGAYSITFNANGTFSDQIKTTSTDGETTENGVHTEEGTYSFSNGQLTLKYNDEDETDIAKATVTGNSLVIVYEDDDSTSEHTIIEVTEEHYTK